MADWERRFGVEAPKCEQRHVKPAPSTKILGEDKAAVVDALTPVVSSRAVQTDPLTLTQVIELLKRCHEYAGKDCLKMA
jgi:hypothetical protein